MTRPDDGGGGDGGELSPEASQIDGAPSGAEAGAVPEEAGEAATPEGGSPGSDAGVGSDASSSGGGDAGAAVSCGGGPVYTHNVGIDGITWQDCVPTAIDEAGALAACHAYHAAKGCAGVCTSRMGCLVSSDGGGLGTFTDTEVLGAGCGQEAAWAYASTGAAAPGHVSTVSCPTASSPAWN